MYNNSYQTQKENNMDFKRKKQLQKRLLFGYFKAFSLVELMISLIIISLIAAAFVPVVTKKLSSDSIISGNTGKITTNCEEKFGENCKLCDKNRCINCEIANNDNQKFIHQDTCSIKSCSDERYGYGANCLECNSSKCTKCDSKFYVSNGKCVSCEIGCTSSRCYCDGVNQNTSCSSGYYCDDNGRHLCSDKFGSLCYTCNSSACTSCAGGYGVFNGMCKECRGCGNGTCSGSVDNCISCCGACAPPVNGKCALCADVIPNCYTCNSRTNCTNCESGYFVDNNGKCQKCDLTHCLFCQSGSSSPKCDKCEFGYFLTSSGTCQKCSDKNCFECANDKCTSCNSGFVPEDGKCIKNDEYWKCSDQNFMKVGKFCYTRRNMGDSPNLPIPNTVTVVNYKNGYCYAQNQKCCWQGDYSEKCDNKSDYNDCKRTVCNWQAAKEICEKFNYEGKIWRLPDMELNVFNFGNFTTHLKENGLQMCGFTDSFYCPDEEGCYSNDYCSPRQFWSSEETGANTARAYYPWYTDVYNDSARPKKAAFSVRCATIF